MAHFSLVPKKNRIKMMNAITIDVEDYYQVSAFETVVQRAEWDHFESRVERNTYRLLDILDEYKTKGTFFVLGWVAERHPSLVREIDARGHEVASHGYSHQRVYTQSPEKFREETRLSKRILEDTTGKLIAGYRAASYSITEKSLWALDILIEEGYLYDSSIFPIMHDRYGIPSGERFSHVIKRASGEILEFPLSTVRFCSNNFPVGGGGYLRLFPYPVTKWAIGHLNIKEKHPAIVYLHPWEVDPDQPRIDGSFLSKFRHYVNLRKTEQVVKNLLTDFQFVPMRELSAEVSPMAAVVPA